MISASFDEANAVLDPPPGMTLEQCNCLSVLQTRTDLGVPVVVSCFKVTAEELVEIQRTGRVWLTVLGASMPPVKLDGIRPF